MVILLDPKGADKIIRSRNDDITIYVSVGIFRKLKIEIPIRE